MANDGPALATMHEMMSGFVLSQAIFVVAELDVATVLLAGPRRVGHLAVAVGADPDALGRIIRFLAQHGVFRLSADTVEVTNLGRTLADGPSNSLRTAAKYFHRTHYAPFGNLLQTVRTGEPAATSFLGKPFFEWVNDHPDLADLQNDAMACFTRIARGNLLDIYDMPVGEVVADLGGRTAACLSSCSRAGPGAAASSTTCPARSPQPTGRYTPRASMIGSRSWQETSSARCRRPTSTSFPPCFRTGMTAAPRESLPTSKRPHRNTRGWW